MQQTDADFIPRTPGLFQQHAWWILALVVTFLELDFPFPVRIGRDYRVHVIWAGRVQQPPMVVFVGHISHANDYSWNDRVELPSVGLLYFDGQDADEIVLRTGMDVITGIDNLDSRGLHCHEVADVYHEVSKLEQPLTSDPMPEFPSFGALTSFIAAQPHGMDTNDWRSWRMQSQLMTSLPLFCLMALAFKTIQLFWLPQFKIRVAASPPTSSAEPAAV